MKCMKPNFVPDKTKPMNIRREYPYKLVPCGKCELCYKARASAWSFRLRQEAKYSTTAFFMTLTYDTENVPISRNGYLDLNKKDLQVFLRAVRDCHAKVYPRDMMKLKYYAVGEYGGKLKRPHYHVIMFNVDLDLMFDKVNRLVLDAYGINGKVVVRCKQWDKGHVTVGECTPASVGYTLKYISKPEKNYRMNDDRLNPFSIMSKSLGASYLSQHMVVWHRKDIVGRMYCSVDGKKITMPRYYKDRIYSSEEKELSKRNMQVKLAEQILYELMMYSETYEQKMIARRKERDEKVIRFNNKTKILNYEQKRSSRLSAGSLSRVSG